MNGRIRVEYRLHLNLVTVLITISTFELVTYTIIYLFTKHISKSTEKLFSQTFISSFKLRTYL